ncbi:MAG: HypC/HybG/HupF family hydrogenase formation chaperone [Deltaproteobacteria bacterium]|nr:HypC/HybG/HupF family hydrogenase formation chaperone [Deltaproteobacteria bacterium]
MCLGIPGRVIELEAGGEVLFGKVDFAGVVRRVCLAHVDDVSVGQYVLVHVGFALTRIDEAEAQRVFELLRNGDERSDLETGEA